MTHFRATAGTVLLTLALAGCGGSSTGSSNQELSYSEFAKQANAICKEERAKTEASVKKLTGQSAHDKAVWPSLLDQLRSGYDRFEKLNPPEELQPDFDRFNAAHQETLTLAEEAGAAADQGDEESYAHAFKALQDRPNSAATAGSKLGAAECAK
ncbi:MAG: hypothetical protein QOG63_2424 [Thermoleophilaceae bacterium]|nr:hypothetical protein [Thermoleophilaceae bacterium]